MNPQFLFNWSIVAIMFHCVYHLAAGYRLLASEETSKLVNVAVRDLDEASQKRAFEILSDCCTLAFKRKLNYMIGCMMMCASVAVITVTVVDFHLLNWWIASIPLATYVFFTLAAFPYAKLNYAAKKLKLVQKFSDELSWIVIGKILGIDGGLDRELSALSAAILEINPDLPQRPTGSC